jgi:hypothetical protein
VVIGKADLLQNPRMVEQVQGAVQDQDVLDEVIVARRNVRATEMRLFLAPSMGAAAANPLRHPP